MLDITSNQPTKFSTKKWVELNDDASGKHKTNSQIKYQTSMLRSSLYDYGNTYILVKRTVTIPTILLPTANNNKEVVFKECVPFSDCISEINSTHIDNAKYIDVIRPMYNLKEYSNNYSKT